MYNALAILSWQTFYYSVGILLDFFPKSICAWYKRVHYVII